MKKFIGPVIVIMALLVNGFVAMAQVKPVVHFTENDGLAGNRVWDVIMDGDGILWVATDNGISRYDGTSFENLYKSNGLPSQKIGSLALGSNKEMYAGCSLGGLVVIRGDSIKSALRKDDKSAKKHYFRELLFSKRYNKLIIGTENGLFILHDSTMVEVNYKKDTTDRSIILSITETPDGIFFTVLKGKTSGLFHLRYNAISPSQSTALRISDLRGRFASTYVNGELFCGEQNKIFSYSTRPPFRLHTETVMDTNFWSWELFPYKDDLMWIGGIGDGRFRGGVKLYDTRKKMLLPFELPQNIQTVNSILYDPASGVTWFGRDNGLTAFTDSPFEYIDMKGKENILDKGFIGDSLIILTEDRLLYTSNEILEPILTKEKVRKVVEPLFMAGEKKYGRTRWGVFDISFGSEFSNFRSAEGKLFLQTGTGTVSIPDLETYLPFGVGQFVFMDKRSSNICGAYAAVDYMPMRYFPDLRYPDHYTDIENTPGIDYQISKVVTLDGVVYFSSRYNGLLIIKDDKIIRLNQSNSSIENNLLDMCVGPGNEILCLSGSNRIFRVKYSSGPRMIGELDIERIGLVGNSIKWIEYNGQHLYIATNEGLNLVNLHDANGVKNFDEAKVIKFFNANNGYKFVSASSPIKDKEGNLIVHTGNEIVIIHPGVIDQKELEINIHDIHINDKKIELASLAGISLPFSSRQISFRFRGIKYPSARNLKYRYKVNNEAWVQGSQVMLQSLRPGDYDIVLEMTDLEDNRVITRKVNFSQKPPFWHNRWVLLLAASVLTMIIYLLFRWRYNLLRRREEEKTRMVIENSELQLRSLQFQMNPHFIFNALTSIQYSILKNNVTESLNYLNNVSSIIRTSLTNASKEFIPVTEEVDFLNKYIQMEKVRFKDKLHIELQNQNTDSNLLMPPMLIQPLVENAIKHAINPQNGGFINIDFIQETDVLKITVKDNGIGIKAAMAHRSNNHPHFGLATVEKRIALLNRVDKTNLNRLSITDLGEATPKVEAHDAHDAETTGTLVTINLALKRI